MHRQTGNYVITAYRKGEKGGYKWLVRGTGCRSQAREHTDMAWVIRSMKSPRTCRRARGENPAADRHDVAAACRAAA
jgi:hypothetical protein